MYGFAKAFGTILAASFSFAVDFSGPVVSVLDGDTIEVLHNPHPSRIRLSGIGCHEKSDHWPEPLQTSVA
jgi:endonuclease YncB( thermonuclease family)